MPTYSLHGASFLQIPTLVVYSSHYGMRITSAYDKRARKAHYKVRHANIRETEFEEMLSKPVVVIGQGKMFD